MLLLFKKTIKKFSVLGCFQKTEFRPADGKLAPMALNIVHIHDRGYE